MICECGKILDRKSSYIMHKRFCDGTGTKRNKKINNTFKVWICLKCGCDIKTSRQKHYNSCDGNGTKKFKRKNKLGNKFGYGRDWIKGKKFDDIYGLNRSAEIKRKISESSKNGKGIANTPKLERERRKKISLKMVGNRNGFGKYRRYSIKYNDIILKSKWELYCIEYFNKNNIKWQYEPTTFKLDATHTYTPDFYLKHKKIYIETKGYWRKENKKKFNKFKKIYPNINIEVWDKKILKKLNILK